MSNLTAYNKDGLELVIDNQTGETFASIRATARMCEVDTMTISRFKGVAQMALKTADIQTAGGLQGVALLNEHQLLTCLTKYNPQLLLVFAQAGLRMYLHQLVGYKVTSTAVEPAKELTKLAWMRLAIEAEEARETLILEAEAKEPVYKYGESLLTSEDSVLIGAFAKALGIKDFGRNKMFSFLRDVELLRANNEPYQEYINQGLFDVHQSTYYDLNQGCKKVCFTTNITTKGQMKVTEFLRKEGIL